MKHCWQTIEVIKAPHWDVQKRKKVGILRYQCKQCGSEFVTDNVGKVTSKDWRNPLSSNGVTRQSSGIADDCAEQVVSSVTNA